MLPRTDTCNKDHPLYTTRSRLECNKGLWCEYRSVRQEAVYRKERNEGKTFKLRFNSLLKSKVEVQRKSCRNNILEGYTTRKVAYKCDTTSIVGIAQPIATIDRGRCVGKGIT